MIEKLTNRELMEYTLERVESGIVMDCLIIGLLGLFLVGGLFIYGKLKAILENQDKDSKIFYNMLKRISGDLPN